MGLLFDMDGVLINSNAAHLASWQVISKEDGVEFSKELFWQTFGMTSEYIVERYWGRPMTQSEIARVVERKETAFRESILNSVTAIPGAVEFVVKTSQKGVKVALGSSAPRINVEYVVNWLGLKDVFGDAVVAGDEVERGKPAPDIFLAAAEKLNLPPQNCIVIDDSRSGVNAGKNAGMIAVGFFSEGHRSEEYERADLVVKNFDELEEALRIDDQGTVSLKI